MKISQVLEIARFAGVFAGFWLAFKNVSEPILAFHYLAVWVVASIAGVAAIEGLFFFKQAAAASGYADPGPYQRQSGLNNLAVAIMSLVVFFFALGHRGGSSDLLGAFDFPVTLCTQPRALVVARGQPELARYHPSTRNADSSRCGAVVHVPRSGRLVVTKIFESTKSCQRQATWPFANSSVLLQKICKTAARGSVIHRPMCLACLWIGG